MLTYFNLCKIIVLDFWKKILFFLDKNLTVPKIKFFKIPINGMVIGQLEYGRIAIHKKLFKHTLDFKNLNLKTLTHDKD